MNNLIKITLLLLILFLVKARIYGQHTSSPLENDFIFSAIAGTISKPDSIIFPAIAISVKLINGDTSNFKILRTKRTAVVTYH